MVSVDNQAGGVYKPATMSKARWVSDITDSANDGRFANCNGLDVDREVGDPLEVVLDRIVVEAGHCWRQGGMRNEWG